MMRARMVCFMNTLCFDCWGKRDGGDDIVGIVTACEAREGRVGRTVWVCVPTMDETANGKGAWTV